MHCVTLLTNLKQAKVPKILLKYKTDKLRVQLQGINMFKHERREKLCIIAQNFFTTHSILEFRMLLWPMTVNVKKNPHPHMCIALRKMTKF